MKKLSFLFCFFLILSIHNNVLAQQFMCPNGVRIIVNELNYGIDIETNEITFDLSCDPCIYDDGGSNCECRKECSEIEPSEEDLQEYHDCIDKCHEDYGDDPVYEDYCLDGCEAGLYSAERNCLENCGPPVGTTKTAETFGIAYDLWWTHGLVASTNGTPDESFAQIFNGEPGNFIHQTMQDFMDESISYCINYQVIIKYDDGTCCDFRGSQCFHKG